MLSFIDTLGCCALTRKLKHPSISSNRIRRLLVAPHAHRENVAIVAGLQPAKVARLSICYPSAASFEIHKRFRLDANESLSPIIVVSEPFLFVFIV